MDRIRMDNQRCFNISEVWGNVDKVNEGLVNHIEVFKRQIHNYYAHHQDFEGGILTTEAGQRIMNVNGANGRRRI